MIIMTTVRSVRRGSSSEDSHTSFWSPKGLDCQGDRSLWNPAEDRRGFSTASLLPLPQSCGTRVVQGRGTPSLLSFQTSGSSSSSAAAPAERRDPCPAEGRDPARCRHAALCRLGLCAVTFIKAHHLTASFCRKQAFAELTRPN